MRKFYRNPTLLALLGISLLSSACSTSRLLMGTEKPIDEKSNSYGVADLSQENPDWIKLDPSSSPDVKNSSDKSDARATEVSDVAYQSHKDASIISLNSACGPDSDNQDLHAASDVLFYGITDVTYRQEVPMTIQDNSALQTTVQGKLNGQSMMLRAVVLRRGPCIYDLMYVSRPQHFTQNEADFSHFVASLKLR